MKKEVKILYTYKVRSESEIKHIQNKYKGYRLSIGDWPKILSTQGYVYINVWNNNELTSCYSYIAAEDGELRKVFTFKDYLKQAEKL